MKAHEIGNTAALYPESVGPSESADTAESFKAVLEAAASVDGVAPSPGVTHQSLTPAATLSPSRPLAHGPTRKEALAAYAQHSGQKESGHVDRAGPAKDSRQMTDWEKYKDDQLLRDPGGSRYTLDEKKVADDSEDRQTFLARMKKDASDVIGNIGSFFGNFLLGTKILYRDRNNQIQEGNQRGLVGTCVDFLKNTGSALTLGLWHPDDEKAPVGFAERLGFFGRKLKKAILGDVLQGIPQSVNHMGKNLILAGWNLVEVLPDATMGNLEAGRKASETIFDNGQVVVEYLTDVLPSGDAWLRVHAASLKERRLPILYNISMPEQTLGDTRWEHVRNTPLRKTLETVGALLADAVTLGLGLQTGTSGSHQNKEQQLEQLLR